MTYLTESYMNH